VNGLLTIFTARGVISFQRTKKQGLKTLSLKSLVPPRLVDEGQRAQPQWMFQFLSRPVELRPWLKMRMPNFNWTYQKIADLIKHFAALVIADQTDEKDQMAIPYVRLPVKADYDPETWIEYSALYLMFMEKMPEIPKGERIEDVRPGSDVDWTSY
jgi:hypothetical protein